MQLTRLREALQRAPWDLTDWSDSLDRLELWSDTSPGEALDVAKSLVESVCKTILDDAGVEYDRRTNLIVLAQRALDAATGNDIAPSTKTLLDALTSVVQGLAETRNRFGTIGHGRAQGFVPAETTLGELSASAAEAVICALFSFHAARPWDPRTTTQAFRDLNEDKQIDATVPLSIDEARNLLIIGDGIELRPSEILYAFDREAYNTYYLLAREAMDES